MVKQLDLHNNIAVLPNTVNIRYSTL